MPSFQTKSLTITIVSGNDLGRGYNLCLAIAFIKLNQCSSELFRYGHKFQFDRNQVSYF